MRTSLLAILFFGLLFTAHAESEKAAPPPKLWAGISVMQPLFGGDITEEVLVYLAVVDEGDKLVNPGIKSCALRVNGKVPTYWADTVRSGLSDGREEALPAGDYLVYGWNLTEHFQEPGIYKLDIKGEHFQTSEIIFRVLPKAVQ
jgi:hypothetical protein